VCTVLHLVCKENNGIPPGTNNLCNLPFTSDCRLRELLSGERVGASDSEKTLKTYWSRETAFWEVKTKHSQFARKTVSTNKLVCELCAEFIPATRAAEQNHQLTVGQPLLIV
jgi:hypothetical protein